MSLRLHLAILAALVGSAAPAYPCRCEEPPDKLEGERIRIAAQQADVLFAGKVIGMTDDPKQGSEIRFAVSRFWKGHVVVEIVVQTPVMGECGYRFEKEREYLVYARARSDDKGRTRFETTQCTRTRPLDEGTVDPQRLGQGVAPSSRLEYVDDPLVLWGPPSPDGPSSANLGGHFDDGLVRPLHRLERHRSEAPISQKCA